MAGRRIRPSELPRLPGGKSPGPRNIAPEEGRRCSCLFGSLIEKQFVSHSLRFAERAPNSLTR
jgi:hypothetical protein